MVCKHNITKTMNEQYMLVKHREVNYIEYGNFKYNVRRLFLYKRKFIENLLHIYLPEVQENE